MSKAVKPIGGRAYGSIGHLPQSRTGPSDWHVPHGQAAICLEKERRGDRIVVTEKLDGACMAVALVGGNIIGLTRAGYRCEDGAYPHLRAFARYVRAAERTFACILRDGERIVGEWLALAHGTKYDETSPEFEPFVAFDLMRGQERALTREFEERVCGSGVACRAKVHDGGAFSVARAMALLGTHGFHGATDPVEGAVWRVERDGRVDFLAKFVRADKVDGRYLAEISGLGEIWNTHRFCEGRVE